MLGFGTVVDVNCIDGYTMIGYDDPVTSLRVECQESGLWSSNVSDCRGKSLVSVFHSTFRSDVNLFLYFI